MSGKDGRKGFFVGVISCGGWCGYSAYYVVADTPGQVRDIVIQHHFQNFKPEQLTIKVVEIDSSSEIIELDEIDLIG